MPNPNAGLTVAGSFLKAFNDSSQLALEKERQASDLQMRGKQMERQDQLMAWEGEDRQYRNDVVRPLEEQKMRLGNASQILGLQSQSADMRYREEMTRAASLRTGSSTAIWDSYNSDPRIQSGLDAGLRLFGGQGVGVPAGQAVGKATRYGYANDSTPDSNSSAGIGAWVSKEEQARIKAGEQTPNRLRSGDLAFSPDVERAMQIAGIKPGQSVAIQYADGSEHTGRWMDRTATEHEGKKLSGRFDVYDPDGSFADRDGHPVVSFRAADSPDAAPVTASQVQTMRDAEALLDSYETAQEYVQRFTGQDSRGNPVLDPRAQPIAEQAFAMETAIKANPMLVGMAKQRAEQRQEQQASQAVAKTFEFYQPGQLEDFRSRQPGAFNVLQRWNANQPVPLESKLQATKMLQDHASNYKAGQGGMKALPASALTMLQTIGRAQAMQRPQDLPDPTDKEGKRKISADPKAVAEWEKAQADAAGAKTALAAMAMYDPSITEAYQRLFPPQQKPDPKAAAAGAGAAPTQPSEKSDDLPDELRGHTPTFFTPTPDRDHAHAAAWTERKNTVSAPFMEDADMPSKDLLYAAMLTAKNQYVDAGESRYVGMAGPGTGMGGGGKVNVESSPARALLLSKKLNPDERIDVDGQSFTREEVLTERLKEIAEQRGYGKTAQPQRAQQKIHRGLTFEEAQKLPPGSLVEDDQGKIRQR